MGEAMGRRILVVEDDAAHQELLARILRRAGYEALVAGDGELGQGVLKREPIDLVILDWNLPKMDGGELAQWIRKTPALSRLPILMLTVRSRPDEEVQGFECGADDYLPKPYTPKELMARLEKLLKGGR